MNVLLLNSGSTANDHTGNHLRSGSAIINFDFVLLDTSASLVAQSASILSATASLNARSASFLAISASLVAQSASFLTISASLVAQSASFLAISASLVGQNFAALISSASAAAATNSLAIGEAARWMCGWAWETFDDYPLGTITSPDKGFGWPAPGVCSTGSAIITRSFDRGAVSAKVLSLTSGAQYGRKLPFGDGWSRMLIAVMMRVNNTASQMSMDGKIGVCSGTTNMAASATCNNFFGWEFADPTTTNSTSWASGSALFSGASGSGNYRINPAPRFCSKRGTTTTDLGGGSGTAGNVLAASNLVGNQGLGFYSVLVTELQRPVFLNDSSSITYGQAFRMTETGSVEFSICKSYMLDILTENPINTSLGGFGTVLLNTIGGGTGGTTLMTGTSFDQSTGKLDTLNISWHQSASLEIAAVAVKKLY